MAVIATQLFFRDDPADTHLATNNLNLRSTNVGWGSYALATTRGNSAVAVFSDTSTVTGPTAGIETAFTANVDEWISPPLTADVTIAGTITGNLWASESNMSANVSINLVVEIIRANVLGTVNSNTLVEIARTARTTTEVAVTTPAVNNFTFTPTSTVANRGDRIRVRVFGDDGGSANMATGFTFRFTFDLNAAAASGDSYITFTETFSFESAPAGSQLFLTNEQSGLSAAPALISDFTGADENPLSEGGNWASTNSTNPLQRISNAVAGIGASSCSSYWTPGNLGPDLSAFVTFSTFASLQGIAVRIQAEGASTWDGYSVIAQAAGNLLIRRVDNAANTTIATGTPGGSWASGDKIGVRIEGSTIEGWAQIAGSTEWKLLATAVDTTYASAGKIALIQSGTTGRLDDFYASTDSEYFVQEAWTSRGGGVVSYLRATTTGWTAPLYQADWYTPELEAFTLTGMAQANIRALESNASANASVRCEIARVESDGSSPTVWANWCIAPTGTDNGELTTSEVARTANVSGDDLAISDGQRLRIRVYSDDISSAAMANAFNTQVFYNGTSAAASGDTYVTLAQTVTEFSGAPGEFFHDPLRVLQAVNRSSVY